MIRINLIPTKEIEWFENIKRELTILLLSCILIFSVIIYFAVNLNSKIRNIKSQLEATQIELKKYEGIEKKLAQLEKEKKTVEQKLKIVSNLGKQRNYVISILQELVARFPVRNMWFEELTLNGTNLTIKGVALDNEIIAEFMRRLKKSTYFIQVELIKTEKKQIEELNLKSFTLECKLEMFSFTIQGNLVTC